MGDHQDQDAPAAVPSLRTGGNATQAGTGYQNRVAAWLAVRMLSERDASAPWDLPANTLLTSIRCETEHPVDDLLVETSDHGRVFIQVKHQVGLDRSADSELSSTVDQFVRQYIVGKQTQPRRATAEGPLDPACDRLVLVTSSRSPATLRLILDSALRKHRSNGQLNAEETRSLEVLREHIKRSSLAVLGTAAEEGDISALLGLIRIQTLDVDDGLDGERQAKDVLRQSVIHEPDQADLVWAVLIQVFGDLATNRAGTDRSHLQRRLVDSGLSLRPARTYRDDIDRLLAATEQTVEDLEGMSSFWVDRDVLKIERDCVNALANTAQSGSVLVVGDPGAGKSGALRDMVSRLRQAGTDVVFIAVDHINAQSHGLIKTDLGLSHDLSDVLENWVGEQPGYLVIDALDAARSERSVQTLRDLVERVMRMESRWRIVASIRKFDLRHDRGLQRLFRGGPPDPQFHDPEFARVRHVRVPLFSDDEMAALGEQSPVLSTLLQNVEFPLRDLLRVPFNLRLMGDLIGDGIPLADLAPIRTQIELLDRFWEERVITTDGLRDARETVLRRVASHMVNTHALRAPRFEVVDAALSQTVHGLLSAHVLFEWQPSPTAPPDGTTLAFAHHVLFDYAVSRLVLRTATETPEKLLAQDPMLVFVVRPSLVMHFQYLWSVDSSRSLFWNQVLRFMRQDLVPEVGKVIGPGMAVELAIDAADLDPLFIALDDTVGGQGSAAVSTITHLVGALLTLNPSERKQTVFGTTAGPWSYMLERLSRHLSDSTIYPVRALVATFCEKPEALSREQRDGAGVAARRLFEYAWAHQPIDHQTIVQAIQATCRTFASDTDASAALIRLCLHPDQMRAHGYEVLPWLAREVEWLIDCDAGLVRDLYRAAFGHEEDSKEPTRIGRSNIMSFLSTRSQDYDMALYLLAEAFPTFLKVHPVEATHALLSTVESYVASRHRVTSESDDQPFEFNGEQACIRMDYSSIWDSGDTYRSDEVVRMLDAFSEMLSEVAADSADGTLRHTLVGLITRHNRSAVIWRRLIDAAAANPEVLGMEVRGLCWATPVLTSLDTSTNVGNLLSATYPLVSQQERAVIETTILKIPAQIPEDLVEAGEHTRDRLLGCIPPEHLVTAAAKDRITELSSEGGAPANVPPVSISKLEWSPHDDREYLKRRGVPVDEPANEELLSLQAPLQTFVTKYLNAPPLVDDVAEIMPALQALRALLESAEPTRLHPQLKDSAWDNLAEVCTQAARCPKLADITGATEFLVTALIAASQHPVPNPNPVSDRQFGESLGWSKPAPRISAAAGLIELAASAPGHISVLETIGKLIDDPVPAVRFQLANQLTNLHKTADSQMWHFIERLANGEQNDGVLLGLVVGTLDSLAPLAPDTVVRLVSKIWGRLMVLSAPAHKSLRTSCVGVFLGLYLRDNQPVCQDVIHNVADNPVKFHDEAHHVVTMLRGWLTAGPLAPANPSIDASRQRAWSLLARIVQNVREPLGRVQERYAANGLHEDEQLFRNLAQLVDTACNQLYFASGAFDEKDQAMRGKSRFLDVAVSRRFLVDARPLITLLSEFRFAKVTHHLVETLAFLAPLSPAEVFRDIARIVGNGTSGGYQFESLAADVIVKLVERYLAEFRGVLYENEDCRRLLLELLDIFVRAGWPSARRLTYRMEEIFR